MSPRRWIGIAVAILGSLAFALPFAGAGGAANAETFKGVDDELLAKLKKNARGSVTLTTKKSTKAASFVRAGRNGDLAPGKSGSANGKALAFLAEYGGLFGITDVDSQLVQTSAAKDAYGTTHVTWEQMYKGVPVFGGVLRAHVDAAGDLTAVNGVFVPGIDLSVSPRLSAAEASARAIAAVRDDPPVDEETGASADTSGVAAAATRLYVYRTGLVRDAAGSSQLVYQVEVTDRAAIRDFVFVNASSGKVVNRYSAATDALFRRVYEQNLSNQVWQEGDAFPGTLNQDQQNIVNFSGNSYYQFFNAFGRDSYDGAGAEMKTINNDPRISCPNANWNGITTNYCNGVTSDDVVAHEWGHAYTEYTHGLIYQWQPGALNEAYSDIWGETVDMLNGVGTDSPAAVRSADACSTHTRPIPILLINSPASIAGICAAGAASFGPPLTTSGVTADVVLGDDGVGTTSDACTALANGAQVSGKIALVDRGNCTFTIKVKNAQNAGAIGVVVADNVAGPVAGMSGSDPTITIPSLRITKAHGDMIKGELANGVNVTMKIRGDAPPEDSYRWLMGEDSTAFGGAIRDMWSPTCLQDPGKVTDAEYHCATSDSGGVHTNSGIPNHGFALLVDGGTYNGHTVGSIGLVKAAHLYWRAQSAYQTPTSDFADHADSLEASCNDLVGVSLEGLSTSSTAAGPSGQSITAADCAAVGEMIAAVQLRTEPTQCGFEPLLKQNPGALCANVKNPTVHYSEDFEDGLAGWTTTNQGVFSGWPGLDWVADATLPGGRSGTAAYGADLDGQCSGGEGDVSGVMRLESPAIHLPTTATLSPRLTFDHYVATEASWDGGNVKISVNGGAYAVIPSSAFQFNQYNATLQTAAAGNTNPLAGEAAFSGTDGGEVGGSWGQSQIDLTKAGAKAGDTIRLRFDNGMDGCTGVDGWYVDDVKIRSCNAKKSGASGASSLDARARQE